MRKILLLLAIVPQFIAAQTTPDSQDSVIIFEKSLPTFEIVYERPMISRSSMGGCGIYNCDSVDQPMFMGAISDDRNFDKIEQLDILNDDGAQSHPWISENGLNLYFTYNPPFDNEDEDYTEIRKATRKNRSSDFSVGVPIIFPMEVGNPLNCHFSSDEKTAFVTSTYSSDFQLWKCTRPSNDSPFTSAELIRIDGIEDVYIRPTLTADEQIMFLVVGGCPAQRVVLRAKRQFDGNYLIEDTLALPINFSPGTIQFSKDENSLIISGSNGRDGFESFYEDFQNFKYFWKESIPRMKSLNINASFPLGKTSFSQLSISGHGDIVGVASDGWWSGNDLFYISDSEASGQNALSIIELQLFPNPASDVLNLTSNQPVSSSYEIFSTDGKRVAIGQLSELSNQSINIESLSSGYYHIRFDGLPAETQNHQFLKI